MAHVITMATLLGYDPPQSICCYRTVLAGIKWKEWKKSLMRKNFDHFDFIYEKKISKAITRNGRRNLKDKDKRPLNLVGSKEKNR